MKKAIIVSGNFNPIHKGHIEYFNQAKQLGDILIVTSENDLEGQIAVFETEALISRIFAIYRSF